MQQLDGSEPGQLTTGLLELGAAWAAEPFRAKAVEQQVDLYAASTGVGERGHHVVRDRPFVEDELLQRDRPAGIPHGVEQERERTVAVQEQFDPVAREETRACVRGERREEGSRAGLKPGEAPRRDRAAARGEHRHQQQEPDDEPDRRNGLSRLRAAACLRAPAQVALLVRLLADAASVPRASFARIVRHGALLRSTELHDPCPLRKAPRRARSRPAAGAKV
jgi:hypothetical protein